MKNIIKLIPFLILGIVFTSCRKEKVETPSASVYVMVPSRESDDVLQTGIYTDESVLIYTDQLDADSYVIYTGAEGSNPEYVDADSIINDTVGKEVYQTGFALTFDKMKNIYSTQLTYKQAGQFNIKLIATNYGNNGEDIKRAEVILPITVKDTNAYFQEFALAYTYNKTSSKTAEKSVKAKFSGNNLSVEIPFYADRSALVAAFKAKNALVTVGEELQVSEETANDFSSPVVYTISAPNGNEQNYTVTVVDGGDTEASIESLTVEGIDEGLITIGSNNIVISHYPGFEAQPFSAVVAGSGNATIMYNGSIVKQYYEATATIADLSNNSVLIAKAQDGTEYEYQIILSELPFSFTSKALDSLYFKEVNDVIPTLDNDSTFSMIVYPSYLQGDTALPLTPVFAVRDLASVSYRTIDTVIVYDTEVTDSIVDTTVNVIYTPIESGTTVVDFMQVDKFFVTSGVDTLIYNIDITTY